MCFLTQLPRDLCHHKQEWGKKMTEDKVRLYQRYGGRGIAVSPLKKRSLTMVIIRISYRNPGNVMTENCMVQQAGVKKGRHCPLTLRAVMMWADPGKGWWTSQAIRYCTFIFLLQLSKWSSLLSASAAFYQNSLWPPPSLRKVLFW